MKVKNKLSIYIVHPIIIGQVNEQSWELQYGLIKSYN